MVVLGIDIGTSGAKAVVLDAEGRTLGQGRAAYALVAPRPGWAEQAPATWIEGMTAAMRAAVAEAGVAPARLAAIGLSGQMHGVVTLDANMESLGDAITWADGRSAVEAAAIEAAVGRERVVELVGTRIAPGFMAATLAWLARREPARWAATRAVAAPKDWVRRWLTGEWATEPSDAAGTGLCAVARPAWSPDLLAAAGVPAERLPPILPSAAIVGGLREAAAGALGLPPGLPVVAGCADTAGMALAAGVAGPGDGLIGISTGGQALAALAAPRVDPAGRLHTFHHALPDRWYLMGATLAAGLALRWVGTTLLGGRDFGALMALAARAPAGAGGLLFQPYLLGERTPHHDPDARAALVGLRLAHGPEHVARAALEGVAFSLRDAFAAVTSVGGAPSRLAGAGGGFEQALWRQTLADTLGLPLWRAGEGDLAAIGAARLAGVAAGYWPDAAAPWPPGPPVATPGPDRTVLAESYQRFRALSPRLHENVMRDA